MGVELPDFFTVHGITLQSVLTNSGYNTLVLSFVNVKDKIHPK